MISFTCFHANHFDVCLEEGQYSLSDLMSWLRAAYESCQDTCDIFEDALLRSRPGEIFRFSMDGHIKLVAIRD